MVFDPLTGSADAVVLHHRAGLPEGAVPGRPGRARPTGPAVSLVSPLLSRAVWVLVAAAVAG
jgi:hypothetical protein